MHRLQVRFYLTSEILATTEAAGFEPADEGNLVNGLVDRRDKPDSAKLPEDKRLRAIGYL